jgi:hypothetical protein
MYTNSIMPTYHPRVHFHHVQMRDICLATFDQYAERSTEKLRLKPISKKDSAQICIQGRANLGRG